MSEGKYSKYIVTDLKKEIKLPGFRAGEVLTGLPPGQRRRMNHIIWMDDEVVPGSSIYSELVWFFPDKMINVEQINRGGGPKAHAHPFSEIITFFGTNYDNPEELGAEVELWLEGEQYVLDRSFLCFVPAGMEHCPLYLRNVQRPVFHFTIGPGSQYR